MTLREALVAEIVSSGPLSVARYMDRALYDPKFGYYGAGRIRTGRKGHFLTSPELDRAFGESWARAFENVWRSCGSPARFRVTEVGGGEGAFAAAVLGSISGRFADALSYVLVEPIEALRVRQSERLASFGPVAWEPALGDLGPADGCVFANEVLDNLPVHVVENRNGTVVEVGVGVDEGRLVEVPMNPSAEVAAAASGLPTGMRREVGLAAGAFTGDAARSVARGALFFVDYGTTEDRLQHHPAGTLLCYSSTGADDRYLETPGEKDITSHANWTDVARVLSGAGCVVAGPVRQREVLKVLGIDRLQEELRAAAHRASAEGAGVEVVRSLSRRGAVSSLLDPGGLGGLEVLAGARGIDDPAFPPFLLGATRD